MERVIVSVKRADLDWSRDLELPNSVPGQQLVRMVAKALRWPLDEADEQLGGYVLEARPAGRELGPADTLAGTGVWDGAWLIFHPGPAVRGRPEYDTGASKPGAGWRRVDDVSPVAPSAPTPSSTGGTPARDGFSWKRVDED